jgi:hypothetical protein
MAHPPDPEMRNRPGANRTAIRKETLEPEQSTESTPEVQARKLRRLFSFCQATAYTIASLAFAVSR